MGYDYEKLTKEINILCDNYDIIERASIGKTILNREIACLKIGNGNKKVILSGAYHGLEYITSAFLMKFAANYIVSYTTNNKFYGRNTNKLYNDVTLYIIPMINPDGVDIAVNGLDLSNKIHRELIKKVGIHNFDKTWQANANGVDINHNFDANWQSVMDHASPTKYGGIMPESENETKYIVDFIRKIDCDMLLAFHSQGGEIYYDFNGMCGENSEKTAKMMAEVSGYIMTKPEGSAVFGGCKDWFIKEFCREGFTIEVGKGKNPLPMEQLKKIYEDNAKLILAAI